MGREPPQDCLLATRVKKLRILPAGHLEPEEALTRSRSSSARSVDQVHPLDGPSQADLVILDTPAGMLGVTHRGHGRLDPRPGRAADRRLDPALVSPPPPDARRPRGQGPGPQAERDRAQPGGRQQAVPLAALRDITVRALARRDAGSGHPRGRGVRAGLLRRRSGRACTTLPRARTTRGSSTSWPRRSPAGWSWCRAPGPSCRWSSSASALPRRTPARADRRSGPARTSPACAPRGCGGCGPGR